MTAQNLPTDAELEILQIMWQTGPCTVRQVNDTINTSREIGYTTTLKTMQIMLDKGLLKREVLDRIHLYTPAVSETDTQTTLLNDFVSSTFRGSPSSLVMRMLGSEDTTQEELSKIKKMLNDFELKNNL